MLAVAADLFDTAGGVLTFATALITLITFLVSHKRVRNEVIEVKTSTNGRLDRMLRENQKLREHIAANGGDPDEVLGNGS